MEVKSVAQLHRVHGFKYTTDLKKLSQFYKEKKGKKSCQEQTRDNSELVYVCSFSSSMIYYSSKTDRFFFYVSFNNL